MARTLTAALLVASVACGGGGGDGSGAVRLQVFGDGAEVAAYRELIGGYTGGDVQLVAVPSQGDHMAKLSTAFAGGNPPDLFLVNYRRFGQFAGKDVLEPLEGVVPSDDLYQEPLDAFRYEGKLLCLPQNVSSLAVYYNRTLFEEVGVAEPPDDWTWDDFIAAAKALTRDTDGDGRTDVYGVGTEPNFVRIASFVWQAGAQVVDDLQHPTRTTLLGPDAVRAVTFFINLRREHKVSPSLEEAVSEDYEDRFAAGRLAMLLESRRAAASLRTVAGLDWDVAPLPHDRERATILHADAYCMARASARKEQARAFVRYALGPEGATILARTGRTVPSNRAVADSPAFREGAPRRAQVFLDNIPIMRRLPNIATWHEIETKADVRVEEWYYGFEAPEQLGIEIDLDTRELFASDG